MIDVLFRDMWGLGYSCGLGRLLGFVDWHFGCDLWVVDRRFWVVVAMWGGMI